jgi:hypothetical protein
MNLKIGDIVRLNKSLLKEDISWAKRYYEAGPYTIIDIIIKEDVAVLNLTDAQIEILKIDDTETLKELQRVHLSYLDFISDSKTEFEKFYNELDVF